MSFFPQCLDFLWMCNRRYEAAHGERHVRIRGTSPSVKDSAQRMVRFDEVVITGLINLSWDDRAFKCQCFSKRQPPQENSASIKCPLSILPANRTFLSLREHNDIIPAPTTPSDARNLMQDYCQQLQRQELSCSLPDGDYYSYCSTKNWGRMFIVDIVNWNVGMCHLPSRKVTTFMQKLLVKVSKKQE